jgi:hypothetical protein
MEGMILSWKLSLVLLVVGSAFKLSERLLYSRRLGCYAGSTTKLRKYSNEVARLKASFSPVNSEEDKHPSSFNKKTEFPIDWSLYSQSSLPYKWRGIGLTLVQTTSHPDDATTDTGLDTKQPLGTTLKVLADAMQRESFISRFPKNGKELPLLPDSEPMMPGAAGYLYVRELRTRQMFHDIEKKFKGLFVR